MYERFTDRSRKVMQLANQEAQRFNHEYIGTEHMLLGVVAEGSGVAANVLKNLNIDLRKVRSEVEQIVQHGPGGGQAVKGRLPHTPRAQKVIDYAIDEARRLRHNYVGTEHLLLGLLRETEGLAAQVLMNLGLKLEDVRAEVLNLLGRNLPLTKTDLEVALTAKSSDGKDAETAGESGLSPGAVPTQPGPLTDRHLRTIRRRIQNLTVRKEAAVMEQDFDRAARCRDEAAGLKLLLEWYEWFRKDQ